MKNVTDRTSNPFGMDPDCENPVFGYGDANADFHVVGDHPSIHGGTTTGVPFTGSTTGERLQAALHDAGVLTDQYSDAPTLSNWFWSYLHLCPPESAVPSDAEYAELERFFDAELRAIAAHVLLPVGKRPIDHVLRTYTAADPDDYDDLADLHAEELHGSGFLVVPIAPPDEWDDAATERLVDRIGSLLDRDYRQTTDLGRFLATDDPYLVR